MDKFSIRFSSPIVIFGGLFLLATLAFSGSLHHEFLLDDYKLILNNTAPASAKPSDLYLYFLPDEQIQHEDSQTAPYYRPIAHILPALQFLLFGPDPLGYHLSNIVLLALACFCFYLLFREFGKSSFAFLSAALFCVHPLNGLMVNYITANVYSVQLIFLSLSAWFYLRRETAPSSPAGLVAMGFFILALFCHETSLMLPGYLFLISWSRKQKAAWIIQNTMPFFVIAGLYFLARLYFADIKTNLLLKPTFYADLNIVSYLATFFKLLFWYVEKFFTGQDIVLMWSTPLVKSGSMLWLLGGMATIGILATLVSRWRNDARAFFILWFVLGLLPVTWGCMFLPKNGFMIEPHWFFFASFGLFALVAQTLLALGRQISPKIRGLGLVGIFFILLNASWANSAQWKDELTYARQWVRIVPTNKSAAFYLAHALMQRGQIVEAKVWFERALSQDQSDWDIYNNLGMLASQEGREDQALDYFQSALRLSPRSSVVNNNIGSYYLRNGKFDTAQNYFNRAAQLNPRQVEAFLNLGLAAEIQGKWDQAWTFYDQAAKLRPQDEKVLFASLRASLRERDRRQLIPRAEKILERIRHQNFLNELAGLLALRGETTTAIVYYRKSLLLYPHQVEAYRESGKILANAGYPELAREVWQEGLEMNPQEEVFKELLRRLTELKVKP